MKQSSVDEIYVHNVCELSYALNRVGGASALILGGVAEFLGSLARNGVIISATVSTEKLREMKDD